MDIDSENGFKRFSKPGGKFTNICSDMKQGVFSSVNLTDPLDHRKTDIYNGCF